MLSLSLSVLLGVASHDLAYRVLFEMPCPSQFNEGIATKNGTELLHPEKVEQLNKSIRRFSSFSKDDQITAELQLIQRFRTASTQEEDVRAELEIDKLDLLRRWMGLETIIHHEGYLDFLKKGPKGFTFVAEEGAWIRGGDRTFHHDRTDVAIREVKKGSFVVKRAS